jgi:hypothetical protein
MNCDSFALVSVLQGYANNCMVANWVAIAAAFSKCTNCRSRALQMKLYLNIHDQGHVEAGARLATLARKGISGVNS